MRAALCRVLCVAVAALALTASSAGAVEVPNHPLIGTITGERISKSEQLKGACGVAVDSKGDVYVADYYQNRVVVFNKEWKYLTMLTAINPLDAGGVAPVDGPCDLAVDSVGNLYVNDYHQDVLRFTPASYPPTAGTTYGPPTTIDTNNSTGVAVDPANDRVYVDDRTHIAVYEPSGAPVMEGSEELHIGEGSLEDAYGVAISSFPGTAGRIYVADAVTETVKVYDPALDPDNPQMEIFGEGTQEGRFYLTDTDLAVDPEDGHLYLSNNLEPHFEEKPELVVDEFSTAGHYRGSVPDSFTAGTHSFLQAGEPSGLAIAKGGQLYVTSGNYEDAAVFVFGPPAPAITKILSVAKSGSGEGKIASIPAGIGCGGVCEGEFKEGLNVVLKATPFPGSVFGGWSGCDEEPSPGRCAVAMGSDRSVSAEFALAPAGGAPLGLRAEADYGAAEEAIAVGVSSPAGPAAKEKRPQRRRAHHRRHRKGHRGPRPTHPHRGTER